MVRKSILMLAVFLGWGQVLPAQEYGELSMALVQGRYAEVISIGQTLGDSVALNPKFLVIMAMAHERLEQDQQALEYYQRALTLTPKNVTLENSVGRCLLSLGRVKESENVFSDVLQSDSLNFFANSQLAKINFMQRDYRKAVERYGVSAIMDTTNYYFYKQLGECYSRLGFNPFAVEMFSRAFRLNPRDAGLTVSLATAQVSAGNIEEALAECEAFEHFDSLNVPVMRYKGYTLLLLRKFDEVEAVMHKLLSIGDTSAFTYSCLGYALNWNGLIYQSVEPLEKAYKLDTTNFKVITTLASAIAATYDPKMGLEYFDKAEALISPRPFDLAEIVEGRAHIYEKLGKVEMAYSLYNKAFAIDSSNILNLYNAAMVAYQHGHIRWAKESFRQFVFQFDQKVQQGSHMDANQHDAYETAIFYLKRLKEQDFFEADSAAYRVSDNKSHSEN